MKMTDMCASKHGNGSSMSRLHKETFSQVHSNVTQPSRPASDKIAKWILTINIAEHRLCVKQCRFYSDHAQIGPKTTCSLKTVVFCISQLYP